MPRRPIATDPLTAKGEKILKSMEKQYGSRAESVLYASKKAGTISGVDAFKPTSAERMERENSMHKRMVERTAERDRQITKAQAEHNRQNPNALINRQQAAQRVAETTFLPGGRGRR
jgi:hypothetical protein